MADLKSRGALQSNSSTSVMPSAADLFVFYKKCLVQCSSLSTGPPLLDLTQLFQKYLRDYCAKVLTPNLPKWVLCVCVLRMDPVRLSLLQDADQ